MKKSLLAVAAAAFIAAALSSSVSATTVYDKDGNSLDIYGRVQSVYYSDKWSENNSTSNEEGSVTTSARLGLDLRTQLTSGIAGFAKAEWEAANGDNAPDGEDGFDARYLYVGVDFGQFGQIKVGKFEEAIKYAISPTDFFEDAGCVGLAGNDDRRESVVQYSWSGYGIDGIVSYAFAKDNEHLDGAYMADESVDLEYSVSAALGYTSPDVLFGPIGIRAGFAYGKFADGVANTVSAGQNGSVTFGNNCFGSYTNANGVTGYAVFDDYTQWAVSAFWGSLEVGPYVAAAYQSREFSANVIQANGVGLAGAPSADYTVSGFDFTVAYTFSSGVRLATGYEMQTIDFDDDSEDLDAATVPVLAIWSINPNFDLWAEARFDANTDDDEAKAKSFDNYAGTSYAENVFSIGARYNF